MAEELFDAQRLLDQFGHEIAEIRRETNSHKDRLDIVCRHLTADEGEIEGHSKDFDATFARLDVVESTVATLSKGLFATQEHLGKVATQANVIQSLVATAKDDTRDIRNGFTGTVLLANQFHRQCSTLLGRLRWLLTGKVGS